MSLQMPRSRAVFALGVARNVVDNLYQNPHTSLLISSDSVGWSLDEDARALLSICSRLGLKARMGPAARRKRACVHYTSQFVLDEPDIYLAGEGCRYSLSYFHGGPEEAGFENVFGSLAVNRQRLAKAHVSNSKIENALLEAGFAKDQVAKIPIGINIAWFPVQTESSKAEARRRLGMEQEAFVIGSFQKDGRGWGEGMEPKLIKGPDVFIDVMRRVRDKIPRLTVLLSGPSRGYVKKELEELGINYAHFFLKEARDIALLYQALDLYLVTSRVEGGPKAVLESMASGVPLVTTRVGQAADLVTHGENAWMSEADDADGLAEGVMTAYSNRAWFEKLKGAARAAAERQDYIVQTPLWRDLFFKGFVEGA